MKNVLEKINKIQTEIGKISKNAENPFFNSTYADLGNIQDALQAYLDANRLMTFSQVSEGHLKTTIFDLESGESITSEIPIAMQDPQKKGSEITYYRRYNLVAMFDLKINDDDGNSTVKNKPANNKVNVDIWMNDRGFEAAKSKDKESIKKYLDYYDCKTKQEDGKVYGMKKAFRTELEKLI